MAPILVSEQVCSAQEAERLLTTLREVYRRGDEASEAVQWMLQQLVGEQAVSL